MQKWNNTFIYPFIGEILDMLIEQKDEKKAELIAQRILQHNEKTYKQLATMLEEAYEEEKSNQSARWAEWVKEDKIIHEKLEENIKNGVLNYLNYSEKNQIISFFYSKQKDNQLEYFLTNIVRVRAKKVPASLKELVLEINMSHEQIVKLKETWGCE